MSIFKRASESEPVTPLPKVVTSAFFDDNKFKLDDEFEALLKEASDNSSVYENRVKSFKVAQNKGKSAHEFVKPEPAMYDPNLGGIRRAGYGQIFEDESQNSSYNDKILSTRYDSERYAENGFSIWEPEFDTLQQGFENSQRASDQIYDRRTTAEIKAAKNQAWEREHLESIRKAKVLPYRGLGVSRLANEKPLNHNEFGSSDEYYAAMQDNVREMVRQSNNERKTKIQRQGADPKERREAWENKEAIAARTMESMQNSSFLAEFADSFELK